MSSTAAFPDPPKPLPQVPGPKLAPFTPTAHADIEFIRQLGDPKNNLEGHVWEVKINGMAPNFALKMVRTRTFFPRVVSCVLIIDLDQFRFCSYAYLQETNGLLLPLARPGLYMDYMSHFNRECRVYGRLKDENREDLAIRAHGYLFLTPEQEAEVIERCSYVDSPAAAPGAPLNGDNSWGRYEEHRDMPVQAIVKQLATGSMGFGPALPKDLWRDLKDLHRLGILVRDLKIGNYIDGKLVDFGHSWTMPCPSLAAIHPRRFTSEREGEVLNLEVAVVEWDMAGEWGESEVEIPQELQDCASGEGQSKEDGTDRFGNNPTSYDWRKWEEDLEATDAFHKHELFGPPEETT
jgi:serine/threonine protein kinase